MPSESSQHSLDSSQPNGLVRNAIQPVVLLSTGMSKQPHTRSDKALCGALNGAAACQQHTLQQ